MGNMNFFILPATDDQVFRAFQDIWRDFGSPENAMMTVHLVDNGGGAWKVPMSQSDAEEQVRVLRESGETVFRQASMSLPDIVEGAQRATVNFSISISRPTTAEQMQQNQHGLHEVKAHMQTGDSPRVWIAVRRAFHRYDATPDVNRALGPELTAFYARREQSIHRLEDLAQQLIKDAATDRYRLESEFTDRRRELDQQIAADRKAMNDDFAARGAGLLDREKKLAEEKEALDDRSAMHARRGLRADLKSALTARSAEFSLSEATNKKRWPIHVLFVLLCVGAGVSFVLAAKRFGLTVFDMQNALGLPEKEKAAYSGLWGAVTEFVISAVSFFGALAFYIRWNDAWASRHAAEEFKMRRLEIDVDRASWLVEVVQELTTEKGISLPPEVLNRLSANLFEDLSESTRSRHPAEDIITALAGVSSGAKIVMPGGTELSIGRNGMKKLAKGDGKSDE